MIYSISRNLVAFTILATFAFLPSSCSHRSVADNKVLSSADKSWLKPGILNSDRIKEKFGSYGVDVLHQDSDGLRLANLYSLHDGEKFTRTIALVRYERKLPKFLKAAHEEILKGGSIGSTLKNHGFVIKKEIYFKGQVGNLPPKAFELMKTKETVFPAIVYDLSVKDKAGNDVPYCTISEIYAPEFLSMSELDYLYPEVTVYRANSGQVSENLVDKKDKKAQDNLELARQKLKLIN